MNDRSEDQPSGIEVTKTEGLDWGKVWLAAGTGVALGVGAAVAWSANYGMSPEASVLLGVAATGLVEAAFLAVTAMAMKEKKPAAPKPRRETPGYMPPPIPETDAAKALREALALGVQRGGSKEKIDAALRRQKEIEQEEKKRRRGGLLGG